MEKLYAEFVVKDWFSAPKIEHVFFLHQKQQLQQLQPQPQQLTFHINHISHTHINHINHTNLLIVSFYLLTLFSDK